MNTVEYIYSDLRKIVDSVVVKYDRKAKDSETVESKRQSDRYIASMKKTDTFDSYSSFSKEAIRNAGITDLSLIEKYYRNKYEIPVDKREDVLLAERKLIIENYVEENDYYREMIGLPNKDDTDFFYVPTEFSKKYDISQLVPIHELKKEDIYRLERTYIPTLIEANPDKGYLKYLGSNAVDLVTAREAKNFDIIDCNLDFERVFLTHFFSTYSLCREYFASVIYVKEFSSKFDLYDNFIALNIMIMTIQRMMVNTVKIGVDRDFYDLPSIKTLFDSYGVPFFEELPLDYQRSIMKNLNMLLRYKSTDKVLYDISSILFFDRIQIYKYFLMKEQRFDENENPIFAYKEVVNDEGEIEIVEDVEKMYKFYFQSTDVLERNTALALENQQNSIDYYEVTENDPLWWNDEDLQKELYEQEFNYVETKYLSVNIMYKMTQMMFESIYALNMMLDKKDSETKNIFIDLPRVTIEKVSVFDSIILLCALTAKKNGMKGEIISTPTKILSVLGFNFSADFKTIIDNIEKNPRVFDQSIIKYIKNMDLTSPEDINEMYNNIRELADFCTYKITTTQNIKEYKAYKDLYEALMIKNYTDETLKKKDGTIATTYLNYLEDSNYTLADFVKMCDKERTGVYIKHILGKLNELIPEIEYMNAVEGSDSIMVKALLKLIEFFKSYTVDLESLNVLYLMDSKYYNMVRMVHDIETLSKIVQPVDKSFTQYFDRIIRHATITKGDAVKFIYKYFIKAKSLYKYLHAVICELKSLGKINSLNENIGVTYNDDLSLEKIMEDEMKLNLNEMDVYSIHIDEEDKVSLSDLLKSLSTIMYANEKDMFSIYNDDIHIIKDGYVVHTMKLEEFTSFHARIFFSNALSLKEKYELVTEMSFTEKLDMDFTDTLSGEKNINDTMDLEIRDKGKVYIAVHRRDHQNVKDRISTAISLLAKRNAKVIDIIKSSADVDIRLKLPAKEWYWLSREYTHIENADIKDKCRINIEARLQDNTGIYSDVIEQLKNISIKHNIKISEVCKIFYNLSIADKLKISDKFFIGIKLFAQSAIKNIDTLSADKNLYEDSELIYLKDVYDIQRAIHLNDNVRSKEKTKIDINILQKLDLNIKYMTDTDKILTQNLKDVVKEKYQMFFRHNFTLLIKLKETLSKSEINMSQRESLEMIYNGMIDTIDKIFSISENDVITYSELISSIESEIDTILINEAKLKSFGVIAEFNELITGAFFNREILLGLIRLSEQVNMDKHEIYESYKDFFIMHGLYNEDDFNISTILMDNDSIKIYNDQINSMYKNDIFKSKYSFKETLAVIYE